MAGAWLHCVACAWLVQEVGEAGGRSWRCAGGRLLGAGWCSGQCTGCGTAAVAGGQLGKQTEFCNCTRPMFAPALPPPPPPPQIVLGNDHISFATTKLGSLLQVQSSKDPEGLRVFYYLVQVCLGLWYYMLWLNSQCYNQK